MQLWLRTCLKAEVEFTSMRDNLLYHRLHLVHLDRIHHIVLTLVFILLRGLLETAPSLLNPVVKDVRESKQHRWCDITQSQFVHHFTQVYLRAVLTRSHIDITILVDTKIGCAPTIDVVELLRIVNGPFLHIPNISFSFSTLYFILS